MHAQRNVYNKIFLNLKYLNILVLVTNEKREKSLYPVKTWIGGKHSCMHPSSVMVENQYKILNYLDFYEVVFF